MTDLLSDDAIADMSDPFAVAMSLRDADTMKTVQQAIRSENVVLAFQPVVQTAQPDQVAFHEGLARILDPQGRTIPAKNFIDVIEKDELGRIVDCISLEHGLRALTEYPSLRLSINMSARSIGYHRWHQTLLNGLDAHPGIASRLILEITESSVVILPDVVNGFMTQVQDRGVSFALDDFGAGYTAFRYFKDFVFDILKIDGRFIRGISTDADNQVLAKALMSIGRHFEMFTVAESVETAEDAEFLKTIGVDCMQGFFYGAPALKPDWSVDPLKRMVG